MALAATATDPGFLGIHWNVWKCIGFLGNAVFFSRFVVQWYATEKSRRVVVPVVFWWLSLAGSLLLLAYALFYRKDSVFIMANAFNWIPYIRNLLIHHRHQKTRPVCVECGHTGEAGAAYCSACGTPQAG